MKYLFISDIHGNMEALKAVFRDSEGEWEECLCLGDIVGYGPEPLDCLALVREKARAIVVGNHELAAVNKLNIKSFSTVAKREIERLSLGLSQLEIEFINSLPYAIEIEGFTLSHATPFSNTCGYILNSNDAQKSLADINTKHLFFGHTHIQGFFDPSPHFKLLPALPNDFILSEKEAVAVNPGSVGQPRDGDPRAAYLVLDSTTGNIAYRRVAYDIEKTQKKMKKVGIPNTYIERLAIGR